MPANDFGESKRFAMWPDVYREAIFYFGMPQKHVTNDFSGIVLREAF